MAGKNALKSVKLPDLKVIFWKLTKTWLCKIMKIYRHWYTVWWGPDVPPTHTQTTSVRTNVHKNFAFWAYHLWITDLHVLVKS